MNINEVQIYLPKFLSAESTKELFEGLKDFPNNIDSRLYTSYLQDEIIYQGDGLKNMLVINLPNVNTKNVNCMVLSNTCDIDLSNKRFFSSQIIYTPIINLEKYKTFLLLKHENQKISEHIEEIKKQRITQIFFLPKYGNLEESIVFLDRINNISNKHIERQDLNNNRIFSLSDYGNYLFLLKLSLHFTRIQDKVERRSIRI